MKKSKRIITLVTSLVLFLSVILLPNNIYAIQKNEKTSNKVIIGGQLINLSMNTKYLIIKEVYNENSPLKKYDLIKSIEGKAVKIALNKLNINIQSKQDLLKISLTMKENEKVKVKILRNNKEYIIDVDKKQLENIVVSQTIPFCGTLTYIDPNNKSFGAVAHDLDVESNKNALKDDGDIYLCKLSESMKSTKNNAGYISGEIVSKPQGQINKNTKFGVKGNLINVDLIKEDELYEVANKDEIKKGKAYIVMSHDGKNTKEKYEIEVKNKSNGEKYFKFQVKDNYLLKNFGGITQGMSGAPIIQNGKIIGAVSHLIIKDPSEGIGLYIRHMMES